VNLPLPWLLGFFLVLLRTGALVASAPILGARTIPARVKLALSLFVSMIAFTAAGTPQVPVPATFGDLVALVLSETAVGLAAGLSSRLLLDAAQAGGQAASVAMGLGFGQVLNPNSNAESTSVGELYSMLALSGALAAGLHRDALEWLAASVHHAPPGAVADFRALSATLVVQIIFGLTIAVRVGYPLFAAAVLGHGVLGLLGKAAPQLSLSNLGFGVTIVAGGGALYLVAPDGARMCAMAAVRLFARG
jgi:flagellar biosynthesis protein FliR